MLKLKKTPGISLNVERSASGHYDMIRQLMPMSVIHSDFIFKNIKV